MRRALLIAAAATIAATFGVGHAAELASCAGTAGPRGFPPSVSAQCLSSTTFETTGATSVVVKVTPGSTYTGFLHAYVYSTAQGGSVELSAAYVAGQLVYGASSVVGTLPAGTRWQLKVDSKSIVGNPYQVVGPGSLASGDFGFGEFSATVEPSAPAPAV